MYTSTPIHEVILSFSPLLHHDIEKRFDNSRYHSNSPLKNPQPKTLVNDNRHQTTAMADSRVSAAMAARGHADPLDPDTQAAGLGFVLGAFIGATVFMLTYVVASWAVKLRQRQSEAVSVSAVDSDSDFSTVRPGAN